MIYSYSMRHFYNGTVFAAIHQVEEDTSVSVDRKCRARTDCHLVHPSWWALSLR